MSKTPNSLVRLRPETRKKFERLKKSHGMSFTELADRLATHAIEGRLQLTRP
jgi:hypothetical protein